METLLVVLVVAAIALPFALAVLAAVLWTRLSRRRIARPVDGTLVVTAMSNPTQDAVIPNPADLLPSHEDFVLEGMVTVPGRAPYAVRIADAEWTNRWPKAGQTIPVLVDGRDPSRVQIQRRSMP